MPAEQHVETTVIPGRRLGRRAPKHAPALRLANILTGTVPQHPAAADHFSKVTDWGLYRNSEFGDCGPTSVANDRKLVTRYLTSAEQSPSQDDVFDLYRRSGNPGFDPATDADDNGVDMQTMLEAVHSGGIGGRKCVAFAKVDHTNLDEVRAAIDLFGSLLLGVNLQLAQQDQTNTGVWDYAPSGEWGGHAVLAGRYTSAPTGTDISVITWGQVVGVTDAFWRNQVEEAWVCLWPEHLGTVEFEQGVSIAQLAADYKALTGADFPAPQPAPGPVPPSPAPGPQPPTPAPLNRPDAADIALVASVGPWAAERHIGENRKVATAFRSWRASRGL